MNCLRIRNKLMVSTVVLWRVIFAKMAVIVDFAWDEIDFYFGE